MSIKNKTNPSGWFLILTAFYGDTWLQLLIAVTGSKPSKHHYKYNTTETFVKNLKKCLVNK